MTIQGNTLRNRLREEPKAKPKSKAAKQNTMPSASKEKTLKTVGILMISFSVFLILSLISFLFSWKVDQSLVNNLNWETVKAANPEMTENWMGLFGAYLSHTIIYRWFGLAGFFIPLMIALSGLRLLYNVKRIPLLRIFSMGAAGMLYASVLLSFINDGIVSIFDINLDFLGGAAGYELVNWIGGVVGAAGVFIVLTLTLMVYLVYAFNMSFKLPSFKFSRKEAPMIYSESGNEMADAITEELNNTKEQEEESDEDANLEGIELLLRKEKPNAREDTASAVSFEVKAPVVNNTLVTKEKEDAPLVNTSSWYRYPEISILRNHENSNAKVDLKELEERKNLIVETLENYKIKIDKIEATIGPTVTLYEIIPAAGVRISKIKSLEDDIALSLAALGIRIIAPMPGKGTIGIEVPNQYPEIVSLKEALASPNFKNSNYDLPIILGKTISNDVFVADLTKMPHLLMAGATGQGKSVGINVIISSILYKKHPEDVKFILVDPKKVELSLFKNIEKHFLPELPDGQEAIITDTKMVVDVLKSLCVEMDERYDKLKDAQVRNIKEYNKKIERGVLDQAIHKRLPYIILVIDELADLMMTAGKEVELPIARLAQLARAIGIHLIVATQRPSVNIITGIIKANFPARIAFRVTSRIDSRTILDTGGAEQLIGRGDMLFSTGNEIIRLQCPFIDTDEVDALTRFIMEQPYPEPFRLNIYSEDGTTGELGSFADDDFDPMFEDAARLIVSSQQGSTSMLQRKLKLGYNRAGRLMDQLEQAKIVGPNEGSKAREVLYQDEFALEQFLTSMSNKTSK